MALDPAIKKQKPFKLAQACTQESVSHPLNWGLPIGPIVVPFWDSLIGF